MHIVEVLLTKDDYHSSTNRMRIRIDCEFVLLKSVVTDCYIENGENSLCSHRSARTILQTNLFRSPCHDFGDKSGSKYSSLAVYKCLIRSVSSTLSCRRTITMERKKEHILWNIKNLPSCSGTSVCRRLVEYLAPS